MLFLRSRFIVQRSRSRLNATGRRIGAMKIRWERVVLLVWNMSFWGALLMPLFCEVSLGIWLLTTMGVFFSIVPIVLVMICVDTRAAKLERYNGKDEKQSCCEVHPSC